MAEFLRICVQLRKNIVISGGTGSGKTTLLNVTSGFIPTDERTKKAQKQLVKQAKEKGFISYDEFLTINFK